LRGVGNRVKRSQKPSNESGQIAILFALVFTFLFILFGFVIDFGHLVHNKMNLQIAADAAAYAGASWQARQLNRVAAVNYRMRQDLKEFVMRTQVTHLRHNRNFPRGAQAINGNGEVPRGLDPFICQQAHGYRSLSGLNYQPDTNLCRNAAPGTEGLPPIVVPPVIAAFDPFVVAIIAQIRQIQVRSNQECRAAAEDNRRLAEHLRDVYVNRSQFHANQISELTQWLNDVAREDGDTSNHPLVRTARESFRRNLTLANRDEVEFEILQPQGGQYLQIDPLVLNATLFFIEFSVQGDGCVGRPGVLDFDNMIAGITKNPTVATYFAVKATSRPRMLFMPAKWLESAFPQLTAIAAAKPFGSRLGPPAIADQLLPVGNRPGNNNRMINFSFRPNDDKGMLNTKLLSYLDALHPYNGAGRPDGNQQSGWPDASKGANLRQPLQAIRAPTIFDSAFYTVYPDPDNTNDNVEEFAMNLYPDYLEAAGPNNNLISTPEPSTPAYLPLALGSRNRGPGWIQINSANSARGSDYPGYGEEDLSSHSTQIATSLPQMQGRENEFGFATREQVHSGWAPRGSNGRIGYSVKLVSLDYLTRVLEVNPFGSGAGGRIANPPTGDTSVNDILH